MSEDGNAPREEQAETTSGVVMVLTRNVSDLQRAFTGISATLARLGDSILGIDRKLDMHISRSDATAKELADLQRDRARESGAREATEKIKATWATPIVGLAMKGLLGLIFAGFVAFVARASGPSAADIAAAADAAAKKAAEAVVASMKKGTP